VYVRPETVKAVVFGKSRKTSLLHTRRIISPKKASALFFGAVWMDDFLDKPRRRVNFGGHKHVQKF